MCLIVFLIMLGPRLTGLLWAIFDSTSWNNAFSGNSLAAVCLGLTFLPWATLAFVLFGQDGLTSTEIVIVAVAFLFDMAALSKTNVKTN